MTAPTMAPRRRIRHLCRRKRWHRARRTRRNIGRLMSCRASFGINNKLLFLSPKKTSFLVLAAHFLRPSFAKCHAYESHSKKEWSAGRRRVVGHATRTDVATRSRFGRGARHRTIRLREPPASGAVRLPALHHHRGSPARLSTSAPRRATPVAVLGRGGRAPLRERPFPLCRPAAKPGVVPASGTIRFHSGN